MEAEPFADLKILSASFLDELEGRANCPKCQRSRKYYCYTCYVPVPQVADRIPYVDLPIKLDIIKHPSEVEGKSTSAHAAILGREQVTVYTYPTIPDYTPPDKVLLVFPGKGSKTLEELAAVHEQRCREDLKDETKKATEEDEEDDDGPPAKKKCSEAIDAHSEFPYERVVFIDSTWNQCHKICTDERLKDLQKVEIKSHNTKFWRHQKDKPATYLATIEAIFYFYREFHQLFIKTECAGKYDNLLFFFQFMYDKIKHLYDGGKSLKAYNAPTK